MCRRLPLIVAIGSVGFVVPVLIGRHTSITIHTDALVIAFATAAVLLGMSVALLIPANFRFVRHRERRDEFLEFFADDLRDAKMDENVHRHKGSEIDDAWRSGWRDEMCDPVTDCYPDGRWSDYHWTEDFEKIAAHPVPPSPRPRSGSAIRPRAGSATRTLARTGSRVGTPVPIHHRHRRDD